MIYLAKFARYLNTFIPEARATLTKKNKDAKEDIITAHINILMMKSWPGQE